MEKLTPTEIENIGRLLLSADSKNAELALTLLEQNLYAIPQLIDQISIFIYFSHNKTNLSNLVKKFLPDFSFNNNPAFIFTLQPLEELNRQLKAQEQGKIRIEWQALKNLAKQVLELQENYFYAHEVALLQTLATIEWKGFQNDDAAENYLEQALEAIEGDTKTIQLGMDLFLEAKNNEKAIVWHEKMLQTNRCDTFTIMGLANLYFQNKDFEKAKKYYLLVVEMADFGPAKERLAEIEQQSKLLEPPTDTNPAPPLQ